MKDQGAGLCRVSTDDQRDTGNSLDSQEANIREMASLLGVEVVHLEKISQSSRSGKNLRRKDLEKLYQICKANKRIKYFFIDRVSRMMREMEVLFYYKVILKDIGVDLVFCDPSQRDLNDGTLISKLKIAFKAYEAEAANQEHIETVISKMTARVTAGYYPFNLKPGYTKGSIPGIHEPHPITHQPLKRSLLDVLSEKYTPQESLRRLNDSDFRKVHAKWDMDKFRNFATDPYNAGRIVVERQIKAVCENARHQKMITREEHEKLVKIFNGTYKPRGAKKQYNPIFPMNRIMTCEDCGNDIKFTGAEGHNGFYRKTKNGLKRREKISYYKKYRCRGCGKAYHRDEVHGLISQHLKTITYSGSQRNELTEALETVWRQKQQDQLKRIETMEKTLIELDDTKSKLVLEMAIADHSFKDDIKAEIEKIKIKIGEIKDEIVQLNSLDNDLGKFVKFGLNYTEHLVEDWWDLEYEDRMWCQQLVFPGGFTFNSMRKVGTPKISPIYSLKPIKKDLSFTEKSLLVELEGIAPSSD